MLKREFRLKRHGAFLATYKQGNVVSNEFFTLYGGRKNEASDPARVGFVVSKKIHKRAVKRNRLKRLMRESVRLGIKDGELEHMNNVQSFIFVARDKALELDFKGVKKSVFTLFERISKKYIQGVSTNR